MGGALGLTDRGGGRRDRFRPAPPVPYPRVNPAFRDNRGTCRFASADFARLDVDRVMHRVTVLGEPVKGPTGSVSRAVAGEPLRA